MDSKRAVTLGGYLFPLGVLLYGLILLTHTRGLSAEAALVPYIILSLMLILAAMQVYAHYLDVKQCSLEVGDEAEMPANMASLVSVILSIIAYPVLGYIVGFNLATAIFAVGFTRFIGRMSWKVTIISSLITVISVYYFFDYWLGIDFPSGLFF